VGLSLNVGDGRRAEDGTEAWPPAGLDAIVDGHVHFWDVARLDRYPHLAPDVDPAALGVPPGGDIRVTYGPADHARNARTASVGATVHVNAMRDRALYRTEMDLLADSAARFGFPQAVIGKIDLSASVAEVRGDLAAYAEYPAFRGIRLIGVADWASPQVAAVLEWAGAEGRILDLGVHPDQAAACVAVLEPHVDLRLVVEHAGWPRPADVADPRAWRAAVAAFAALPARPHCKLSGLPMALQSADPDALRPWVVPVLEQFGPERCLFASNFPVDFPLGDYLAIARAYARVVDDWGGAAAVRAVLRDTAASFYQLHEPRRHQ
jgi:predicted TIM-barrel fold metal-dependent hydrolase